MVTTVRLGSVNFPKLLRHLGHRTNQVRNLVFARDAIFRKEVMTTKADSTSGRGSGTTSLSGPAVSFGYEESSFAAQSAGTNAAYHVNTPELIFGGLKAIQSPIISRSGKLERTGHRISGECTFYMPPLSYINNLPEFSETTQFDELETYDKLIDIERILFAGVVDPYINNPPSPTTHRPPVGAKNALAGTVETQTLSASGTQTISFGPYNREGYAAGLGSYFPAGYEIDRFQTKVKRGAAAGSSTAFVSEIFLQATGGAFGGGNPEFVWAPTSGNGAPLPTSEELITLDVPFNVPVGSTTMIYVDGTGYEYTMSHRYDEPYRFDTVGEIIGINGALSNGAYLNRVGVKFTNTDGSTDTTVTMSSIDTLLYKASEWRVESIKDFRDEYMEVKAVRVRGTRTSRRRAYG